MTSYQAVLFDLDGVLTSTAAVHAGCWKQAFDEVLAEWAWRATGAARSWMSAGADVVVEDLAELVP
jgi:beta-phosphoglucomutase-like phosphatase (HAD superfamily)